jgi:hypothetical protein
MDNSFNKNERQLFFNQIKGELVEISKQEKFSYIVLNVGHENKRLICLHIKNLYFDDLLKDRVIGDKVTVRFYLRSVKRANNSWSTMANVITINLNNEIQAVK